MTRTFAFENQAECRSLFARALQPNASTPSMLRPFDFVGLQVAERRGQERRVHTTSGGALHEIADRVLAFGRAAIFHVDQE
jgi:hypothetical protein